MMELSELLQHTQIAVPVALVIFCAVLVFTFGFRKAEQPSFAQLSSVVEAERKTQTKKKSKSKEKVMKKIFFSFIDCLFKHCYGLI